MEITADLVRKLILSQFPQWADLPIAPVERSGWDNRTFRLGQAMTVRMPSAERYAAQVSREQKWLPYLGRQLSIPVPTPLAVGRPEFEYPWAWSIYRWLPGLSANSVHDLDLDCLATDLADFLVSLQAISAIGGPTPGPANFFRGDSVLVYEAEVLSAIELIADRYDRKKLVAIWERTAQSNWRKAPVWVHGDISPANLIIERGRLSSVIDFGQLAIGDPACDYAIAWTSLSQSGRQLFKDTLAADDETWLRGIAWAFWKALIVATGNTSTEEQKSASLKTISTILTSGEHREWL